VPGRGRALAGVRIPVCRGWRLALTWHHPVRLSFCLRTPCSASVPRSSRAVELSSCLSTCVPARLHASQRPTQCDDGQRGVLSGVDALLHQRQALLQVGRDLIGRQVDRCPTPRVELSHLQAARQSKSRSSCAESVLLCQGIGATDGHIAGGLKTMDRAPRPQRERGSSAPAALPVPPLAGGLTAPPPPDLDRPGTQPT
jgi:hypothetical protein